jgi:hypothetical protein
MTNPVGKKEPSAALHLLTAQLAPRSRS